MMISGIYKITNTRNGKIYVGSSKNLKERIWGHKCMLRKNNHHSKYLQNSYNLYGEEMFLFEIIEKCTKDNLLIREQYWMDFYNSYNRENGYNSRPKAQNNLGLKHSEETKKKISLSKTGTKLSKKHKEKISKKLRGKNKGSMNGMFGKSISEKSRNHFEKSYEIMYPNGKKEIVKGLSRYCRKNNLSYHKVYKLLKNYGSMYSLGWRLTKAGN